LEEAIKSAPTPFSVSKKNIDDKPKRKEVNIEELKRILGNALNKDKPNQ